MNLYVRRMISDKWDGAFCEESEVLDPSVADAAEAIRRLDAQTWTIVSLYASDGAYMTIGGGAGKYVVFVSDTDEQLWNLVTAEEEGVDDSVLLHIGGQEGDYPRRQIAPASHVLEAAGTFMRTGELEPTLHWERQQ